MIKDNVLRGKILDFLRYMFPQGTERSAVVSIFYEYFQSKSIVDALEYLVLKDYVTKREFPHPYRKTETLCTYTLNARGVDLHDGAITDVGVTVPFKEA